MEAVGDWEGVKGVSQVGEFMGTAPFYSVYKTKMIYIQVLGKQTLALTPGQLWTNDYGLIIEILRVSDGVSIV